MNLGTLKTNYSLTDLANFTGTIIEKLPNTEFLVKITNFPDGTQVPDEKEVIVTAKLAGKIRDKKIKIALCDKVTVSISMEGARSKRGHIVYRDKGKATVVPSHTKPGKK